MKLTTPCKHCKAKIRIWDLSTDRGEFAKTTGENIDLTCKKCNFKETYHVDEIEATPGIIVHIIATLIFLIGTPLIVYWIWPFLQMKGNSIYKIPPILLIIIPVIVYRILLIGDRNRVKIFNGHKLRGER
jgi:hypothetical protein